MKPLIHAKISAKKFGGESTDYIKLHNWMDHTKAHLPDARHRMILHNSWGIFLGEQIFGVSIINSNGREISVRTILEQHVIDDLGHIPTLKDCVDGLPLEPWMGTGVRGRIPKMKIKNIDQFNIEIVD